MKLGYPIIEIRSPKEIGRNDRGKVKTVSGLVKQLRAIRDEMNVELSKLNAKQRTAYFKEMRKKAVRPTSSDRLGGS